jgi:hypothetical protein
MAMRRDELVYYGCVTLVAGIVIPSVFIIMTLYSRSVDMAAVHASDIAMTAIIKATSSLVYALIFLFADVAALALLQFYIIRRYREYDEYDG